MRCDDWRCKLEVLKSWCALCQQGSCPLLVSMRTSIVKVPVDLTQVHPGAAANGTVAASAASAAANSLRSNLNQADECKKPKHHRSFPHWAPVYCTLQSQGAWATELQPRKVSEFRGIPKYSQATSRIMTSICQVHFGSYVWHVCIPSNIPGPEAVFFQTPPPNPSAPASCLGAANPVSIPHPSSHFVEFCGIAFVTEHYVVSYTT